MQGHDMPPFIQILFCIYQSFEVCSRYFVDIVAILNNIF